jgi:hypothetical protein
MVVTVNHASPIIEFTWGSLNNILEKTTLHGQKFPFHEEEYNIKNSR